MPLPILPRPGQGQAGGGSDPTQTALLSALLRRQEQQRRDVAVEKRERVRQAGKVDIEFLKDRLNRDQIAYKNYLEKERPEDLKTVESADRETAALDQVQAILDDPKADLPSATVVNLAEGLFGKDSAAAKLVRQTPDAEQLQAVGKQFVIAAKPQGSRLTQELLKILEKSYPTLNQTPQGKKRILQSLRAFTEMKKNRVLAKERALKEFQEERGDPHYFPSVIKLKQRTDEIAEELNAPYERQLYEEAAASTDATRIVESLELKPRGEVATTISNAIYDVQNSFEEAAGYRNPQRYAGLNPTEKKLLSNQDRKNTVMATHAFAEQLEDLASADPRYRGDPSAHAGQSLSDPVIIDGEVYTFTAKLTPEGYKWVVEKIDASELNSGGQDATT